MSVRPKKVKMLRLKDKLPPLRSRKSPDEPSDSDDPKLNKLTDHKYHGGYQLVLVKKDKPRIQDTCDSEVELDSVFVNDRIGKKYLDFEVNLKRRLKK